MVSQHMHPDSSINTNKDHLVEKDEIHPAVHNQLRRLSSSHASSHPYCSKCHMRRSSQDLLLKRSHDHSPESESWDGFCPDIVMPTQDLPRSSVHHARRHSGLCPDNLFDTERTDGKSTPPRISARQRPCQHHSNSYHHDCHCESVTPIENLSERYGMVDESTEMEVDRRRSIEKQAMDQVAEIMHEELMADMEARQGRL